MHIHWAEEPLQLLARCTELLKICHGSPHASTIGMLVIFIIMRVQGQP